MTAKTRGIRLKPYLDPDDQGQMKLIEVTYSQLAATGRADARAPAPGDASAMLGAAGPLSPRRRREVARMLRIELEATLALLEGALAEARGEAVPQASPPKR
jgi:hypothetical protein